MNTQLIGRLCISLCIGAIIGLASACVSEDPAPPPQAPSTAEFDGHHARAWVDVILERIEADALSPPQASRILAYTGTAIYESMVDGMEARQPLAGQLNGLEPMPTIYVDTGLDYPSVLHGTLGHLAPLLFEDEQSRHHLEVFAHTSLQDRRTAGVDTAVINRSANRGVLLAEVMSTWIAGDGYYDRHSRPYSPATGPGAWTPLEGQKALEPHWGNLRPFALSRADICKPERPPPYSEDSDSEFYAQASAVYRVSLDLDEEQEQIARFWADDPGVSSTPPGHWAAIVGQMVEELELNLEDAAELYALVGITTADAVISCWDEKYRSYLLRPVSYIRDHIDPAWSTLIQTPPFPEYTSGHSNISGAAALVLTELLGPISFEDRTHDQRGMAPRFFENFDEAALEAARSRLYGGIHYPVGNEQGLTQGRCVAEQVLTAVETRID